MILKFETEELLSGMLWKWTEIIPDYPATKFTLIIIIKKGIEQPYTLTGVANGDDFDFDLTVLQTLGFGYGDYSFQAIVTEISTSKPKIIGSGIKIIFPLLSTSGDTRTYWEIEYDAAKVAYTSLNDLIATEVSFKGKMIKYEQRSVTLTAMNIAKESVKQEKLIAEGHIPK